VELEPGQRFGHFRLDAPLGEGGSGVVFRAVRETDGLAVALKILRRELSEDETFRRRFLHEARAAREVRHPRLVPILEAGELQGRPYLAVSFVDGRSLLARIFDEGPLSPEELSRLVDDVAAGLDALHAGGVVHRDVKPSNVLLDGRGTALLTDFGLAKGAGYTTLTRPGQVMGSLDYLAPELIRGEPATAASDVYALGCTLFEAAVGSPPFGGKQTFQLAMAHLQDEPPDPRTLRPVLPPEVARALLMALAKEPGDRPKSAGVYARMVALALAVSSR
jgi:serine/threonine protein kinase